MRTSIAVPAGSLAPHPIDQDPWVAILTFVFVVKHNAFVVPDLNVGNPVLVMSPFEIANVEAVTMPPFVTVKRFVPPVCNCIKSDEALLAVSVTFSRIAEGVPVVFQVPARSMTLCALLPVSE